MQYYFAPLEGVTDSIYRRLHHRYFPGMDRYYTPFLSPTIHRQLTPKESRELPPADTLGFTVVPQLLTKVPEDFLWMAEQCEDRGYTEVNLNLGCPSGTVTAKGKGSGMLRDLHALDAFLDAVFQKTPVAISVKTRIGFEQTREFPPLLQVFNQYPIKELIIHPRVRTAFYDGQPDMESFGLAVQQSKLPLCYNGNLGSVSQIEAFSKAFPTVPAVMLGRGLLADPGMLTPGGTSMEVLEQFHDALLEEYLVAFGGGRNAMFRMKEHWRYLICRFQNGEKLAKALRKTTDIAEFRCITKEIFHNLPMRESVCMDW